MSGRRNDERIGGPNQNSSGDATAAVQQAIATEPTTQAPGQLTFVVPTEFVEIPSAGAYYPEGHPLCGQDTVEIKYMTAKDEDILTSRSLLKKGVAINRFLQNILCDKRIKTEDLLIGDKNAILVAARVTGYGAEYNTKTTCPACQTAQDYEFTLEEGTVTGFDTEYFDVEEHDNRVIKNEDNTFDVSLPKSDVTVTVRLMDGHDEARLSKSLQTKKKASLKGHETNLTDQLRTYIVAVNGSSRAGHIHQFIESMPALDSRFLRKAYTSLMPNYDLRQHFACDTCGYEQEMEVPFTADFFWPKS